MIPTLVLGPEPWVWTLDPLQIVPVLLAAALYGRRARALARRGRPVARARQASFYGGLGLVLIALVSPIDYIGEERLLLVHMAQHLLLGDLAALAVVFGLTGPVLRPVLALPLVGRLRALAHPLVALPLWAANLYVWHLPALYGAALAHDSVHALQHALFFALGGFMWAALVEPLPGPAWFGTAWKAGYVFAVRSAEMVLANVFLWSGGVFYARYAGADRTWGLSAAADQRLGGAVMMVECTLIVLPVFGWLFLRWARESELRQELVDEGYDPAAVSRAVRYGRAAIAGRD